MIKAVILWISSSALAFELDDHQNFTHLAFEIVRQCVPTAKIGRYEDVITESNLQEDWDLINKWSRYSHYYHPKKQLSTLWRVTADVRVAEIEDGFVLGEADPADLGAAVHMIQDMSSPLHVVPVTHSLDEPFEHERSSLDLATFWQESGLDCEHFLLSQKGQSLKRIIKEQALKTLKALHSPFEIFVMNRPRLISWSWFWEESTDNGYGRYGILGTHFGETDFEIGGVEYQVPEKTYAVFRLSRAVDAVTGTVQALLWLEKL